MKGVHEEGVDTGTRAEQPQHRSLYTCCILWLLPQLPTDLIKVSTQMSLTPSS